MARRTGDPFIDAVYDGIPTYEVNERIPLDLNVAYGVPFEPSDCAACSGRGAGLGEEESLARQTFPVWGTLLAVTLVVVPLLGYQLWKEHRQGVL